MSLPDQAPKLPKTWFLVSDAALLVTAGLIARFTADPFSRGPLIAIVACVVAGGILAVIPFLTDYASKQDEAFDQRQRSLEALATTVNAATEQLSIAAGSLHQIAELAQRNLKHAEHLPQRLQEKVNEFNARLEQAQEGEREELEKELATLRASETEKLETVSDQIHKSVTEFARLEATVNKHLTTARVELIERTNETLARIAAATSAPLAEAATQASQSIREAQLNAAAELDRQLAAICAAQVARTIGALDRHLATTLAQFTAAPSASASGPTLASVEAERAPLPAPEPLITAPAPTEPPSLSTESVAPEVVTTAATPTSAVSTTTAPSTAEEPSPPSEPIAPVPANAIENVAPSESSAELAATNTALAPEDDAAKPARKRAPRKPKVAEPALDLGFSEINDTGAADVGPDAAPASETLAPPEPIEPSLSSDGATRLLVTAYIGIGNKLFLRGDGPGLSRDKGVPLQFVSIGKWRWETNDAIGPVRGRLYKNDELECSALGEFALEPGHQTEVSATF